MKTQIISLILFILFFVSGLSEEKIERYENILLSNFCKHSKLDIDADMVSNTVIYDSLTDHISCALNYNYHFEFKIPRYIIEDGKNIKDFVELNALFDEYISSLEIRFIHDYKSHYSSSIDTVCYGVLNISLDFSYIDFNQENICYIPYDLTYSFIDSSAGIKPFRDEKIMLVRDYDFYKLIFKAYYNISTFQWRAIDRLKIIINKNCLLYPKGSDLDARQNTNIILDNIILKHHDLIKLKELFQHKLAIKEDYNFDFFSENDQINIIDKMLYKFLFFPTLKENFYYFYLNKFNYLISKIEKGKQVYQTETREMNLKSIGVGKLIPNPVCEILGCDEEIALKNKLRILCTPYYPEGIVSIEYTLLDKLNNDVNSVRNNNYYINILESLVKIVGYQTYLEIDIPKDLPKGKYSIKVAYQLYNRMSSSTISVELKD